MMEFLIDIGKGRSYSVAQAFTPDGSYTIAWLPEGVHIDKEKMLHLVQARKDKGEALTEAEVLTLLKNLGYELTTEI